MSQSGSIVTSNSKEEAIKEAFIIYSRLYHAHTAAASTNLYKSIDNVIKHEVLPLTYQKYMNYDTSGYTILHRICCNGHLAMLKFLFSKLSNDEAKHLLASRLKVTKKQLLTLPRVRLKNI